MDASVLRKIKKPIVEKKRRDRINHWLDELKTMLLENVKTKETQVSRLDKAEILEMTVTYIQQLHKQDIISTTACDDTIAKEYKSGYEECTRETIHYLNSAKGIRHDMKSRGGSHLSSCISEVNNVQSTLKYSGRNSAFHRSLGVPVKSSCITPLYVNIPSSIQYPSTTARGLHRDGGLLMPFPGQPIIKTEDPYSPYNYPTMTNDSSICAVKIGPSYSPYSPTLQSVSGTCTTSTEDSFLNQCSGYSCLSKQFCQVLDSSICNNSLSNSESDKSVTCDKVWRPW